MTAGVRLALFDIDGTLLWSDGAGRRAFGSALSAIFGDVDPGDYRFDGKTDRQIGRELLRMAGHGDDRIDARMDALLDRYLVGLRAELAEAAHRSRLLPGVAELLDALEARDEIVLGLLTGNIVQGAQLKLRAVGLDPARFRVGAFGSDHEQRPRLPAVAQLRAREQLGLEIPSAHVVVIGDTPADIECAHAAGARAIAVATGRYSVDELREHRPAAVFRDLTDTDAVVEAIRG